MELDGSRIRNVSGILHGNLVYSIWKEIYPKNLGKINETSAEQQAELEVDYQYTKKLSQGGYTRDLEEATDTPYIKPMLANLYEDSLPIDFSKTVYSQPKFDGMRCIANLHGLWTRKGKKWLSVPHIDTELKSLFQKYPDCILDGELYNHDYHDDFDSLSSILRQTKLTQEDIEKSEKIVRFYVYDIVNTEMLFSARLSILNDLFNEYSFEYLNPVETVSVEDQDHLDWIYFEEYIPQGYEGQIIRYDKHYALNKRNKAYVVKRKEFITEEFQIVDIVEGEGNWSSCAKSIIFRLPDGRTSDCGIRGTQETAKKLLENKHLYINSDVTVRFPNYTPDGKPRFAVAIDIHNGKRSD